MTVYFANHDAQFFLCKHVQHRCWQYLIGAYVVLGLHAAQPAIADENPYASNYQMQNQGNLHSMQPNVEPQLLTGKNRNEDNISMLENGYDLIGFSNFEDNQVPPEMAIEQGRTIQADLILVYVKKAGNQTPSAKMEYIKQAVKSGKSLTEKDMAVDSSKFRYYATYWAKLPPPILGVHVIKLMPRQTPGQETVTSKERVNSAEENIAGVRIVAVIHQSAAEKAGLIRGDQLIRINKQTVEDAAALSALVRRLKGQSVPIEIERQGEPMSLQAQL